MMHDEEPKLLPKEPIPDFKSIEEEAEFWDTHDFTDYLDEFKPVNIRISKDFRSDDVGIADDHLRRRRDRLNRLR